MKILVTGGAGFIGSHIAQAYLDAGHDVVVLDDLSTGFESNVPAGARFRLCDIRLASLDQVFAEEKPEVVNHQAARANVRESFDEPLLYADVNVMGSLNLLECCRRHGVRKVIYASTGGACYGEPIVLPVTEQHPVNPLDPYGASKHHVEHYLEIYSKSFGVRFTVFRYPNVYGPRQNPHGEAGVVAIFIRRMLDGESIVVNGSGAQQRDFTHVSDIAAANLSALNCGDDLVLNLGSGRGSSVNEIVSSLRGLTSYQLTPAHGPSKAGEVSVTYLDAGLAAKELGWTPQWALEEGLRSTVEAFRAAAEHVRVS